MFGLLHMEVLLLTSLVRPPHPVEYTYNALCKQTTKTAFKDENTPYDTT